MMEAWPSSTGSRASSATRRKRLQEDHRAEHGLAAHLRVAEQGRPQHPVGRHQARPGPGGRPPGHRLRQGRRDADRQEGSVGGVPQRLPRHLEGAGAGLAQGSAAHEEPGHLRAGQATSTRTSSTASRRTRTRYDMGFYYGEVLWTLQNWKDAAEQYTQGRRDEARGQVRQGGGLRGGAGLEERPQRRRPEQKELVEKDREQARGEEQQEQARAADHPRVPEEDDRGLRHVHQVRARRARAGDDQVPQGAHLLRVQPLRRGGRRCSRTSSTSTRSTSWPSLLGQPAARLAERPGQDEGASSS